MFQECKQLVYLNSGILRAVIAPEKGGKLTSLIHLPTGEELLAQPANGADRLLYPGMPFEQGDAAGMDDVFPSMGEPARPCCWPEIPDHGVVWTSSMACCRRDNGVLLRMTYPPWQYEKHVSLRGSTLVLRWRIRNTGNTPASYVWVFHGLWRLEEDMCFFFPGEKAVDVLRDTEQAMPVLTRPVPPGSMAKFYLPEPVAEGLCGFVWPGRGLRVSLRYQTEALQYLGFWITNGGWRGDRNFAFEPACSYYDTMFRAAQSGTLVTLAPRQEKAFSIRICIDLIDN